MCLEILWKMHLHLHLHLNLNPPRHLYLHLCFVCLGISVAGRVYAFPLFAFSIVLLISPSPSYISQRLFTHFIYY